MKKERQRKNASKKHTIIVESTLQDMSQQNNLTEDKLKTISSKANQRKSRIHDDASSMDIVAPSLLQNFAMLRGLLLELK